ncbi:hypothetical protein KFL_003930060 [Klebsormidium nitens]|uniref:Patatin n=1 Tax=Klebsormidium nitens TaxID=105231 RepID=A0A0U9HSZ5_KLENI|nr:hypothetical protein KFL_003930060 [Klebsormidium nitens]|eukprot:GAQ88003.1 hypothetical protein KFL_003930060 [Klebsormidium nitens]
MGKKDTEQREAKAPKKGEPSERPRHEQPNPWLGLAQLSIAPSWRAVQGGDEESGQTRKSMSRDESSLAGGGANAPSGVNGPSGHHHEEAEKGREGTRQSLWFPVLRKEAPSIAHRGFSFVRSLIAPEGVRLQNRGVQAGESFIPQEKQDREGGVGVTEKEGGGAGVGAEGGHSHLPDGKEGPGANRLKAGLLQEEAGMPTAAPARPVERHSSAHPNLSDNRGDSESASHGAESATPGGSNAGPSGTPLRTESSSGSSAGGGGFVRRLEIQIGENGEVKAEEVWQDAMSAMAVGEGDMGRLGSEVRRQLSKIPSDIMPKPEGKVCVLAIDGGGVRGLIPALTLARLEGMLQQKSGNPDARIADYFDMIAGTSVGGLLAVMLLTPNEDGRPLFSAAEAATFIKNNSPMIFYKHWAAGLRQIFKPKYSTKPLERILDYYLTEPWETPLTLKNLLKPCLITSYDLSRASPRFFVRKLAQLSDSHDFRLRDVCRATAAAPSYFKPACIWSVDESTRAVCADGGIIANNPTLAAVNHLIVNREEFPTSSLTRPRLVLSLGAGEGVDTYDYKRARQWGLLGWAVPVMEMMLWGNGNTVDFIMTLFSEALSTAKSYLRIEVKNLTGTTKQLDNATPANIAALEKLTEEALASKAVTLDRYGFVQELDETYGERLEEFADELIAEADSRTRRAEPTVRISAPAPARLREDLRGKKVDRGGDFLSWRKQELPVGARPANPGDKV